MDATAQPTSARPALRPRSGWARVALLLLILFALLRSVLWASVQPAWLAPDEDYHWLYINYLVVKHTVPSLGKPFYTAEIFKGALLTSQAVYLAGARTNYREDPHAVLRRLGGPLSERDPSPPDPRPVLHPPLYHLGGALVDWALWHKVSVTRLTAVRYYSALLGAVTIFFAWLLAAQVLAREWQQLAAAALASTQPILAFSASTITNDVAVAAALTATLAWCAWMLRAPPRSHQGIGLGVLLSIGLLIKATMLSLLILVAVVLAVLWRTYPYARRELIGVVKWTVGVPLVLAGWWYVNAVLATGSILGEHGSLTATSNPHAPGLLHAPSIAATWLAHVYRGYWFDYLNYEVHSTDVWFWLPLIGIALSAIGLGLLLRRSRRTLTAPNSPELRQVVILILAALILTVPPFALDVLRGTRGLPFTVEQGRFLTPAYPGLAVIAIIALGELAGRRTRLFAWSVAATVAVAFLFYWHTWLTYVLTRFYGPIHGHWLRELLHASYDKPNFVTAGYLATVLIAALIAFVGAYGVTICGVWLRGSPAYPRPAVASAGSAGA